MPRLIANQTRLAGPRAVPTPSLRLVVQRGSTPGAPGATRALRKRLSRRDMRGTFALFTLFRHFRFGQFAGFFASKSNTLRARPSEARGLHSQTGHERMQTYRFIQVARHWVFPPPSGVPTGNWQCEGLLSKRASGSARVRTGGIQKPAWRLCACVAGRRFDRRCRGAHGNRYHKLTWNLNDIDSRIVVDARPEPASTRN